MYTLFWGFNPERRCQNVCEYLFGYLFPIPHQYQLLIRPSIAIIVWINRSWKTGYGYIGCLVNLKHSKINKIHPNTNNARAIFHSDKLKFIGKPKWISSRKPAMQPICPKERRWRLQWIDAQSIKCYSDTVNKVTNHDEVTQHKIRVVYRKVGNTDPLDLYSAVFPDKPRKHETSRDLSRNRTYNYNASQIGEISLPWLGDYEASCTQCNTVSLAACQTILIKYTRTNWWNRALKQYPY